MSRPAPKKRQSPDCSDNTPEPKKLSVEVRVFENGQTEVQQTQEDSTVVPTDNSVMSEDCQPGKESVESNDINSLDVLAMAAEKRKLEEVISLREENNKLKCEQMHLQDSLAISRV
ncbi:uncharacterized protein LOC125658098 isoform X2 [Ostrea edulis]|nr:uncharacterized protein LOC125658098 isoform X2 [Ostrea edulis]XP_056005647.1 uncharacterized protein LOC125658098 isoform X2 [Ostrea edulis]